jgi:hypothetical protein
MTADGMHERSWIAWWWTIHVGKLLLREFAIVSFVVRRHTDVMLAC